MRKLKTNFQVAVAMNYTFSADGEEQQISPNEVDRELYVENNFKSHVEQGRIYTIYKYIAISSIHHSDLSLAERAVNRANKVKEHGFDQLIEKHRSLEIYGVMLTFKLRGVSAQQAIRFNIFHLYQTYTGKNVKLNIGPKGFTERNMEVLHIGIQRLIVCLLLKNSPSESSQTTFEVSLSSFI